MTENPRTPTLKVSGSGLQVSDVVRQMLVAVICDFCLTSIPCEPGSPLAGSFFFSLARGFPFFVG